MQKQDIKDNTNQNSKAYFMHLCGCLALFTCVYVTVCAFECECVYACVHGHNVDSASLCDKPAKHQDNHN